MIITCKDFSIHLNGNWYLNKLYMRKDNVN